MAFLNKGRIWAGQATSKALNDKENVIRFLFKEKPGANFTNRLELKKPAIT